MTNERAERVKEIYRYTQKRANINPETAHYVAWNREEQDFEYVEFLNDTDCLSKKKEHIIIFQAYPQDVDTSQIFDILETNEPELFKEYISILQEEFADELDEDEINNIDNLEYDNPDIFSEYAPTKLQRGFNELVERWKEIELDEDLTGIIREAREEIQRKLKVEEIAKDVL